ncbi:MAG: hypothetical protein ABIO86_05250 [Sphingomonas sp.]
MADQIAYGVQFTNHGEFVCRFNIQWDGGETDRTDELSAGQSVFVDLQPYHKQIHRGTSCYARAFIVLGPNHDSGRNFTYGPADEPVEYTISGTTFSPRFD